MAINSLWRGSSLHFYFGFVDTVFVLNLIQNILGSKRLLNYYASCLHTIMRKHVLGGHGCLIYHNSYGAYIEYSKQKNIGFSMNLNPLKRHRANIKIDGYFRKHGCRPGTRRSCDTDRHTQTHPYTYTHT